MDVSHKRVENNYFTLTRILKWTRVLNVSQKSIQFQIDTGSQVNILSMKDYKRLRPKPQLLNTAFILLSAYFLPILGLHMSEELGLIRPSEWVNAMVIVEKPNGKLQICLDRRTLNRAIKRQHYSRRNISRYKTSDSLLKTGCVLMDIGKYQSTIKSWNYVHPFPAITVQDLLS